MKSAEKTTPDILPCPCGSGMRYTLCCEPLITRRADAETALALMRSRYTAYVLGMKAYIMATWAPAFCPEDVDLTDPVPRWLGLQIHGSKDCSTDDDEGDVDFSASYLLADSIWTLRENSRFIRLAGRWYYQNGESKTIRTKVNRNAPCPCGSGRKFKRCCGF